MITTANVLTVSVIFLTVLSVHIIATVNVYMLVVSAKMDVIAGSIVLNVNTAM